MVQAFGVPRKISHFLVYGTYPLWAVFAGSVTDPTVYQMNYKKTQEVIRKDVERALPVLTYRFQILKSAMYYWKNEDVVPLTETSIILHGMIISAIDRHEENICWQSRKLYGQCQGYCGKCRRHQSSQSGRFFPADGGSSLQYLI